jgi:hypothetical protein
MELVESEMLFELYESEQPLMLIDSPMRAQKYSDFFKKPEHKRIIFPIKIKRTQKKY